MLTVSDWGFVLLCFVITSVITWIVGFDMTIKEKLLLPVIITTVMIFLMIALKMMGG